MYLTTKGRYAVTAILDLAFHSAEKPVCLADIAVRQGISQTYLEQLFARLKAAGLVESIRGPSGGYYLGRSKKSIFIAEVVQAVNESMNMTRCNGSGDCQQGQQCLTHALWYDLGNQLNNFLSNISLDYLVQRKDLQDIALRQKKSQGIKSKAIADL